MNFSEFMCVFFENGRPRPARLRGKKYVTIQSIVKIAA